MADRNVVDIDPFDYEYFEEKEFLDRRVVEICAMKFSDDYEEWNAKELFLEEMLKFFKKYYCGKCRNRAKSLQWHKFHQVNCNFNTDLPNLCHVFECSHMEKEEQE